MRWPIPRTALLTLAVFGGLALGARDRKAEEPPPAPDPAPSAQRPEPEPVAAQAPPLWEGGLPVTLDKLPPGLANLSAQGCNACHFQAHDDWAGSAHATAWSSPAFRRALAAAGDSTLCVSCHLPLTSQHAELAAGYIDGDVGRPDMRRNASWDPTLMSEGITCAACHVRGDTVVGLRARASAPHPVAVSTELGSSEFCATCHQLTWPEADKPFYDTYGEWAASAYAKAGIRCQDCHMPPVAGLATATRFAASPSHAFGADPARAVSVLVSLPGPRLQRGEAWPVEVVVQNTGAGHFVPTGSPFKTWRVQVDLLGADGKALTTPYVYDLARKVQDAPPWTTTSDNRLAPGAQVELSTELLVDQKKPSGHATLRVSAGKVGDDGALPIVQEIPIDVL